MTAHSLFLYLFGIPIQGYRCEGRFLGGWYLFQTTLLEPRSGKVLRTEAWSNSTVWSGLFPTRDGGYVVWHDLELSLHAADGTTLKTLTLDPNEFPRGLQSNNHQVGIRCLRNLPIEPATTSSGSE
jgi:hypothetical protein